MENLMDIASYVCNENFVEFNTLIDAMRLEDMRVDAERIKIRRYGLRVERGTRQ